jgi:hypothetical protein
LSDGFVLLSAGYFVHCFEYRRWPCRPKHVVWTSTKRKTIYNKAARRRQFNLKSIPNVTVWRVLRKHLHLKAYKLSIVQGVEHLE